MQVLYRSFFYLFSNEHQRTLKRKENSIEQKKKHWKKY